jgi:hypothetical protein
MALGSDGDRLSAGDAPGAASTEVSSIWQLKPWWCQPWSIVLTGVAVVAASWVVWEIWWITAPLAAAVLVWWWLFLVLVPASYRQSL